MNKLTKLRITARAFSLIEFMIALAIGSIMLGLLYSSLTRTYKTVASIEQTIDGYSTAALYIERFEKDLSGALVPRQVWQEKQDTTKNSSIFMLQNMKQGGKGVFSFITTSALSVYNKPAHFMVRVAYKLEPLQKNLYKLIRYESTELDYKKFEAQLDRKIKGFEILSTISTFELTCIARDAAKPNQVSSNFQTYRDWNSDQRKTEKLSLLPDLVTCKGSLKENNKTVNFEYTVPITAYSGPVPTGTSASDSDSASSVKQVDKEATKENDKDLKKGVKQFDLLELLKGKK